MAKPERTPETSIDESSDKGSVIRRGEVAEFFRKRTQLVGFSMEMHKFTQYIAEFSDNALDAIETYYWRNAHTKKQPSSSPITLSEPPKEVTYPAVPPPVLMDRRRPWTPTSVSERIKALVSPIRDFINQEPVLLLVMQNVEKPDILPNEMGGRNLQMYTFEVIDTGIGMTKKDLAQFGLYLASSKSYRLRQTRGSQGFGASSAFSDAQNTTGRPVVVASRHPMERHGYFSVFYTTGKNRKEYVIPETELPLSFTHGTYLQLSFLNLPYRRGFSDEYVRQTAFLNAHVNLIFLDPYGEVHIYPRRVREFVREPTYAMPHPASTSIGDFQDLLRTAQNKNVVDFLSRNFCRLSRERAQRIVANASKELKSDPIKPEQSPSNLAPHQIKALYASFMGETYYAPPTETVIPVGEEVIRQTLKDIFHAEFVEAVTRPPTSSKGLAFAVEVAAVYDPSLASQTGVGALYRFVNRTPKLRDNSDCAIWRAAASVNWRNYRLEMASNGLPTGPVRLFANVVGPFVHLILKAQSKQALAEDDVLMHELKLAFEEVGRKLRHHIVRVMARQDRERRADLLLKYSRLLARSLTNIERTDPQVSKQQLATLPQQLEALITKLVGLESSNSEKPDEADEVAAE